VKDTDLTEDVDNGSLRNGIGVGFGGFFDALLRLRFSKFLVIPPVAFTYSQTNNSFCAYLTPTSLPHQYRRPSFTFCLAVQ
jgi:hypothetical protein